MKNNKETVAYVVLVCPDPNDYKKILRDNCLDGPGISPFGFAHLDKIDSCKVSELKDKNWMYDELIDGNHEMWWNSSIDSASPPYQLNEVISFLNPDNYCILFIGEQ